MPTFLLPVFLLAGMLRLAGEEAWVVEAPGGDGEGVAEEARSAGLAGSGARASPGTGAARPAARPATGVAGVPARAADPEPPTRFGPLRADTILRPDLLTPRPAPGAVQPRPPGAPPPATVTLGLAPRVVVVPSLAAELPRFESRAPWTRPRVRVPRVGEDIAAAGAPESEFWRGAVELAVAGNARRAGRPAAGAPFLPPPEGDEPVAPPPRQEPAPGQEELPEFVTRYTDLGVRLQGRAELGGDWTRFRPCADQFQETCNPTLVPQLSPDVNLAARVAGTVGDRIRVDVDYDQLREFDATNTISIVYEGEEDDVLQSVEVGDVTFRLPRSRFVTRGLPAGNFGFQAEGQLGPVRLRGVWAEQKGDLSSREFRLTGVGNQRRFVQEDTLVLDDADYARGQFFFLVSPSLITGFPHIDVLELDAGAAPATVLPGIEPIQLYRFENNPATRQQVEGFIQADAVLGSGEDRVEESGWFRYLVPGQDYYVHPSGLWIALRNPVSPEEMLAVTYVTTAGDTVGTYNPEAVYASGGRPRLKLLKASRANHQPGRPTWDQEMHQVYRVSASPDIEESSVEVTISLGELGAGRIFKRAPDGQDITFLQLFGLDQESPVDRIDPAFVYSPDQDVFEPGQGVQGTFVVFPTLRPFAEPPPNPGLSLTADETAELLADDANQRIYEAEDPFERDAGGRFRLTIPFRRRSEGVITSFSLGALGILDGSERILLGERVLVRGIDYRIDYDVGQVTLLDPEALFAANPDAPVRATWEQRQIFREAPTTAFGFNAHVGSDESGRLDLLTLYRSEQTLVRRPTLGLEPGAALITGLSGRLERGVSWMDQLLGHVPGLRVGAESSFALEGEVAMSVPDPNTRGDVFLDDFDATDERILSLLSHEWTLGSAPSTTQGADDVLPATLGPSTLARLVWQHTWILESQGDSVGVFEGFLPSEEIDQRIRVAGTRVREPGLRLTFGDAPVPEGDERWSSITTTLSPTGTDLTKSDFLEFYVAGDEELDLVVDLGMVSEDALFVARGGATSGTKPTGVEWGLGLLDQEADPGRGEIWGNALDQIGVWGEECLAEPGRIYRLGDSRANCTRNNGRNDTEDLDGDGNLDENERTLRYVVALDGTSPFLARTRAETGTPFRLYRIPIRSVLATEVGGPITEADLRAVRHIRLTVAGRGRGQLTLARMRIVGSRWIKRGEEGVLRGIVGDTAAFGGRVEVSPVSRVTEGDAYASPPGVLEQLADPTTAVGGQGVEFSEKSLSIRAENLGTGDRAEVYSRFPQRPRDFLRYREARLWVVGRSGDWGPDEDVRFFFKIGTDPENFYLYRTPLPRTASPGGVERADWLPEVVVDFDVFLQLRTRAEEILSLTPRGPGDPPLQLWSSDSTYAVVLEDRGRAPALAHVREMAMGIWNQGEMPFTGELWVDELRLSAGVQEAGLASVVDARLAAGDVVEGRFSVSQRGAFFRQLDEEATYQDDRRYAFDALARLERLAPADWGVEMPLTLTWDRSALDPTFLQDSDVRADRLVDLRETGSSRTRVGVGFRKVTPSADPLVGLLVDGFETNVAWYRTRTSSVTSRVEARGLDLRVGWDRQLEVRDFDPVPGFLEPAVRFLLPAPLEEAVLESRVRWTPDHLGMGASYGRQDNRIFRYEGILELPADSAVTPTSAPREALETVAEVGFQPLRSLDADLTFLSTRDLLPPVEVVSDVEVSELLAAERAALLGVDLGWETHRSVITALSYRPSVVPWLRHEVGWRTRYASDRNPGFVGEREDEAGDTVRVLERNARGEREVATVIAVDPGPLVPRAPAFLGGVFGVVGPATWSWQDGIFSRFNRDPVRPGAGYQLGWADLGGYRVLGTDTAATLVDRVSHQVSWGLDGGRWGLDAVWGVSEVATLDTRADRNVRTETWPDLRARVDGLVPGNGVEAVLQRVSLSTGVRRTTREVSYGQRSQRRSLDDLAVPVEVDLTWAGGLDTGYQGRFENGEGRDPTGDTERERTTHRISVSSAFLPPFELGSGPAQPVRLTLLASYVAERECRVPAGRGSECVAFVDQLNRGLTLTLDTRVSDFEVGLQANYSNRQSFVGQLRGSTQFQLQVFGQFLLEAGTLGGAVPR